MILFVCTGNTCRSPLAAALARQQGMDAQSAGIFAQPGEGASYGAQQAALRRGLSLRDHHARQLTPALARQAELIYAMTDRHAALIRQAIPEAADRVRVLTPAIPDPYGGDDAVYEACAAAIEDALAATQKQG